jgi:hypothetical protein
MISYVHYLHSEKNADLSYEKFLVCSVKFLKWRKSFQKFIIKGGEANVEIQSKDFETFERSSIYKTATEVIENASISNMKKDIFSITVAHNFLILKSLIANCHSSCVITNMSVE